MSPDVRFKIIFDQVDALRTRADGGDPEFTKEVETLGAELDEVAELRRLAADISDPAPTSYTST